MTFDEYQDKVAIVTGAGSGIGFEIASKLYQAGAKVILNDIDPGLCEAACLKIDSGGEGVLPFTGDCGEFDTIDGLVEFAVKSFGQIDVVVCNAGITTFNSFLDYSREDLQKLFDVNLKGTFFLIQATAKIMKDQNDGGSVLIMSSVTGNQTHPDLAAYGMTKAALQMLAKSLSVELAPHHIRVNAIAPGATLTERTQQDADYNSTWQRLSPTGRPSTTKDIANAALFLLSENSSQIAGQTLIIDGGWSSVSPPPEP